MGIAELECLTRWAGGGPDPLALAERARYGRWEATS
jgi:hypothetical protein